MPKPESVTEISDNDLPLDWPPRRFPHVGEITALASMFVFVGAPSIALMYYYEMWRAVMFVDVTSSKLAQIPSLLLALFVMFVVNVAGKYVWLMAMTPLLRREDVSPLIASGIPRRLLNVDRRILMRFKTRQ